MRPSERAVGLRPGDRVRVVKPRSGYTGCRGTVAPAPESDRQPGLWDEPLGYYVLIDGDAPVPRPFLPAELERLRAVPARRQAPVADEVAPETPARGR